MVKVCEQIYLEKNKENKVKNLINFHMNFLFFKNMLFKELLKINLFLLLVILDLEKLIVVFLQLIILHL